MTHLALSPATPMRPAQMLRRPIRMVTGMILIIAATETGSLLGVVLGVPQLRYVSIAFLGLLALYVLLNARTTCSVLSRPLPALWIALLALVPSFITALQALIGLSGPEAALYWIGVIILTGLCFLSAIIWARKGSDGSVSALIYTIISISLIGFLTQYTNYDLVRDSMIYASNALAASTTTPRLVGFYSHPNVAAISLIILSFSVVTAFNKTDGWTPSTLALMTLVASCILATGSRTSFLLLCLFALAYTVYSSIYLGRLNTIAKNAFYIMGLLVFTSLLAIILLPSLTDTTNSFGLGIARLLQLFGALSPDSALEDASAALRANILGIYLDLSLQSPIVGYGHDWLAQNIGSSHLPIVSQNTWIQWLVEYGYPYALLAVCTFAYTLVLVGRHARRDRTALSRCAAGLLMFLLIIAIATFSINDIFFLKSVVIVFGLLVGSLMRHWAEARGAEH